MAATKKELKRKTREKICVLGLVLTLFFMQLFLFIPGLVCCCCCCVWLSPEYTLKWRQHYYFVSSGFGFDFVGNKTDKMAHRVRNVRQLKNNNNAI